MRKATESKSGIFVSAAIEDEKAFISELDSITESYYIYFSQGFDVLKGIFYSNNEGAVESLKKEISVIHSFLEGKQTVDKLIIQSMRGTYPKYGKRRLPEVKNNITIAQVYKHILSKSEVEIWKYNQFEILQEIAIAKCTALIRYEKLIKEQIKLIQNKEDEKQTISTFHWISDSNKLKKLYRLLTEQQIIGCTADDFETAFSGKSNKQPHIKWLLTSKNSLISKKSIFNFIYKLMEKGFISKVNERILNKVIESIFTDNKGQQLKNLRQSNSPIINKSDDDLITKVISELKFS
jgi:hypothetical protein